MLIYGESGIFAHKKTIKQFLQPMIEQVWGGGGARRAEKHAKSPHHFKIKSVVKLPYNPRIWKTLLKAPF